jgi:DNA-binding response OmpR family regulator
MSVPGMIVVFAEAVPPDLARTLDLGGYSWKGVSSVEEAAEHEPTDGWSSAIVAIEDDNETAWAFCRSLRQHDGGTTRVLLLVAGGQISGLELRDDLYDDFCLSPFHPSELEARLRHLMWAAGAAPIARADIVEYGELVLNLETYQATIAKRPLDLTYMECERL